MTTLKDLKPLTGKFLIFPRRGWWKISCSEPGCNAEYRLEKSSSASGESAVAAESRGKPYADGSGKGCDAPNAGRETAAGKCRAG